MAKPTCVFLALVFALDLSAALQIPFNVLPNSNPQITSLIPSPATWIPQPTLYSGGTPLPSHTPDPLPMPKPEMPIRKSSWALSRIAPGAQPIQWMFPNPPGAEKWGEGVLVYVVDSGVNPMDPELEGAKIDPQGEGIVPALIGRMNPNIKTAKADSLGHGTAVASLIVGKRLGLAPAATIIPVRIVDNDGQESKSTTSEAILGVQAARKHFQEQLKKDNKLKAIINISWRLRHTGTSTDRLAENEIEQAILAGMHVIMSVGNDGGELCYNDNKVDNNIQYYKTRIKDVGQMFIGGTSWLDERSPSSNWGSCVTLWAPGKDIEIPAFPGGTGATQWVEGTSFATPLVSGVAAAILSQSLVDLSPFQLISILQKAATPGVIKGNLGRGNNNLLLSLPAWLLERGGALSGYFRRAL